MGAGLIYRSYQINILEKRRLLAKLYGLYLVLFAGFILVSDEHIMSLENDLAILIVYSVLGMTLTFGFVFAVLDSINYMSSLFSKEDNKIPIGNELQVYSLIFLTNFTGFIYGFLFAIFGIRNAQAWISEYYLILDIGVAMFIGMVIGFFSGLITEIINLKVFFFFMQEIEIIKYDLIINDEFDNEL